MYFNSIAFLVFLPLFLVLFFGTKGCARLVTSLVGSYIFYGWWDVRFLSLIVASTLIDYWIGLRLGVVAGEVGRKRLLLASLASNLGLLFTFKYFNFFRDSLVEAFGSVGIELSGPTLDIVVPVGISFYTFQTLSYTIDVYRGNLRPEPSLLKFSVFVSFFPQLVAGPIVRASDFLPQLSRDHAVRWRNIVTGSSQVLLGFVKKCVIADSLAPYVDAVFENPESRTSITLLLAVVFYAFQIYCDFAGYSDIAIGLARVMGYHFPRNFRYPYFASSFSNFWQRWHISLSSWLRDYLYIPLGGNRKGTTRTYINLMLTMLIGGLWHGAAWTFVVWGGLHGLYLVAQRLTAVAVQSLNWQRISQTFIARASSGAIVFCLVCLAWVFFRSPDFGTAISLLGKIATMQGMSPGAIQNQIIAAKGIGLISVLVIAEACAGWIRPKARCIVSPCFFILYFGSLGLALAWLGTFDHSAFIYFQF